MDIGERIPAAKMGLSYGRLSLFTKLAYGSGDWGMASFGTLRQIYYAIFLTDVVGLDAGLASFAALIGVAWDAINDPLVGMISDRVHTRWGRRRPFLLFFSIPFAFGFLLLWWAPPFESQAARMAAVTLAYMLSDTFQTLISVPFLALTPDVTPDYDERTTLTGYRMFFNLGASLATAVSAPMIVDSVVRSGATHQQGYLLVAAIFGGMAALPFLLIFLVVREQARGDSVDAHPVSLRATIRDAWANTPFRFVTVIYLLNWITFDLVGLMLPFYLTYWIAGGNSLASVPALGGLSLESAVFALLLVTAVLALPLWLWLSRRLNKRDAYIIGMSFWALVQMVIFMLQPGEIGLILFLAVLAGLSVSTAHVLPDAIFPDVIEWAELRYGRRQEGIYYGIKNFLRKLTGAVAIFLALQTLSWVGYQSPPAGANQFSQPPAVLTAIRLLTGPVGAALLVAAIGVTWFYPLSRERHARIRRLLEKRRMRIPD